MAKFVGGVAPFLGDDNVIPGTLVADLIIGDPYLTTNIFGVPFVTGPLLSGVAGDDFIDGRAGDDTVYGDATEIGSYGIGGIDDIEGSTGSDLLYGDAAALYGHAIGGNDRLSGSSEGDV